MSEHRHYEYVELVRGAGLRMQAARLNRAEGHPVWRSSLATRDEGTTVDVTRTSSEQ